MVEIARKVQTYLQIYLAQFLQLSEGQKTKLALCRPFLQTEHYLLLDETSNHLDHYKSCVDLSQKILQHPAGCLVISHDHTFV